MSGCADDTLSVLSTNDIPTYTSLQALDTFTWTTWQGPPFDDVITLLLLISQSFPHYIATRHNCYHYARVSSIVLQGYRSGERPRKLEGKMASNRSRFAAVRILNQDAVYMDAIDILARFYKQRLQASGISHDDKGKAPIRS